MKIRILAICMLLTTAGFAQKGKWVKLFDGKDVSQWYSWKVNDGNSTAGWQVVDGVLTTNGKEGDLVTKKLRKNNLICTVRNTRS